MYIAPAQGQTEGRLASKWSLLPEATKANWKRLVTGTWYVR
jgi:hypothetical protein